MKYVGFADTEYNLVFERFEGSVTKQGFIDAAQEYSQRPDWKAGRNLLSDLRAAQFALSAVTTYPLAGLRWSVSGLGGFMTPIDASNRLML